VLVADQIEAFEMVNPQVFVKGGDYLTRIDQEHRDYCKAHGIELVFTNEVHYSSTDLLHYYDPAHSST
jgi:bifunctional ADP-heptose synthase (sugar kinase/adenylyltransferase)